MAGSWYFLSSDSAIVIIFFNLNAEIHSFVLVIIYETGNLILGIRGLI